MSFKAVQKKIEGQGYSKESAGAILADRTRRASPAAKKANPNLKKVKGKAPAKARAQSQWSGIANQMLAGGNAAAKSGSRSR
jgi:hypothetical protein